MWDRALVRNFSKMRKVQATLIKNRKILTFLKKIALFPNFLFVFFCRKSEANFFAQNTYSIYTYQKFHHCKKYFMFSWIIIFWENPSYSSKNHFRKNFNHLLVLKDTHFDYNTLTLLLWRFHPPPQTDHELSRKIVDKFWPTNQIWCTWHHGED